MDGGEFSGDDEKDSSGSHAEKIIGHLVKYGFDRVAELPLLLKLPFLTKSETYSFACGYVEMCIEQVGAHAEGWAVCKLASAATPLSMRNDGMPKELKERKIRERVVSRAKEDLARLQQLHALYLKLDGVCNAEGRPREAHTGMPVWVRELTETTSTDTAASELASKMAKALTSMPTLGAGQQAPPAAGWDGTHDQRLLLGTALHGCGNFDAIRKHTALWVGAPPLMKKTPPPSPLPEGEGSAPAPSPPPTGESFWPDYKVLLRRAVALIKLLPGATPPPPPKNAEPAAKAEPAVSKTEQGGGGGGAGQKRKAAEIKQESESEEEEDEDEESEEEEAPKVKASSKQAAFNPKKKWKDFAAKDEEPSSSSKVKSTESKAQSKKAHHHAKEEGEKPKPSPKVEVALKTKKPRDEDKAAAETDRETQRREMLDALLAFGLPEKEEEWGKLKGCGKSLKKLSLSELQKAAEGTKRAWELDLKKDADTAKKAKTKLSRLEIVGILRKYEAMVGNKKPSIGGGGSSSGEGTPPSWWMPSKHDTALVKGVLTNGFIGASTANWKATFADRSTFPPEANPDKKEFKEFVLRRLQLIYKATKGALPSQPKPPPQLKQEKKIPKAMLDPPKRPPKVDPAAAAAAPAAATSSTSTTSTSAPKAPTPPPAAAAGGARRRSPSRT